MPQSSPDETPTLISGAPPLLTDLREHAMLLDIDGTILDIAPTPHSVVVPPSLPPVLRRLCELTGGAVALVSGRSLSDIDELFAPMRLPAVGGHGAEIRLGDGVRAKAVGSSPLDAALRKKIDALTALGPGIQIEDKGYSIAVHYRKEPELAGELHQAVSAICAESPFPIEALPGKFVFEFKPVAYSKASGVRELMTHPPFAGRRPVFLGDDITDHTVFAIMPELNGLAFSVGIVAKGVDGHFANPQAVRDWLTRMVEPRAGGVF